VFGDAVVATAILDRLLHHSHLITIRGDSYRLREKQRTGLAEGADHRTECADTGMIRSLPRWVHRHQVNRRLGARHKHVDCPRLDRRVTVVQGNSGLTCAMTSRARPIAATRWSMPRPALYRPADLQQHYVDR
jgi:hypothetical protein